MLCLAWSAVCLDENSGEGFELVRAHKGEGKGLGTDRYADFPLDCFADSSNAPVVQESTNRRTKETSSHLHYLDTATQFLRARSLQRLSCVLGWAARVVEGDNLESKSFGSASGCDVYWLNLAA